MLSYMYYCIIVLFFPLLPYRSRHDYNVNSAEYRYINVLAHETNKSYKNKNTRPCTIIHAAAYYNIYYYCYNVILYYFVVVIIIHVPACLPPPIDAIMILHYYNDITRITNVCIILEYKIIHKRGSDLRTIYTCVILLVMTINRARYLF